MLLTPTYHVFEMYSVHHDATLLPSELNCERLLPRPRMKLPALSASASRDAAGKIHVTLCNLNPNVCRRSRTASSKARTRKTVSGRVLTAAAMQTPTTPSTHPRAVKPTEFRAFKLTSDGFTAVCLRSRLL